MKNFYVLLFCSLLTIKFSYAQKQANIWYFGDHAGIDFNNGTPQSISHGQTYYEFGHAEGSTVMCDSTGSLLFYSNGVKVWNRLHELMSNGDELFGSYSSSQGPIAVPLPNGGDSLFYLFTVDGFYPEADTPYHGLRYSVINMCASGGLGAVQQQTKNILLLDSCLEKVNVVKHSNGNDYWIVVHKLFTNEFYSYLITANGISAGVGTAIGSIHTSAWGTLGQMKVSPDGKRLALASGNGSSQMELFDFDNSTGILSNFINLCTGFCSPYGVSFSPDNSKLYYSHSTSVLPYNRVSQFDLNAGGGQPDSIRNSMVTVWGVVNALTQGGLQLGPDGKIYCVPFTSTGHLSVISNPNLLGLACQYEDTIIYLSGNNVNYTLPGTLDSYDYHNAISLCPNVIDENISTQLISIYPIPAFETLVVSSAIAINSIGLYNAIGERVQFKSQLAKDVFQIEINISDFSAGIYFIQVNINSETFTKKIIKL